jgi:hypothetical protein
MTCDIAKCQYWAACCDMSLLVYIVREISHSRTNGNALCDTRALLRILSNLGFEYKRYHDGKKIVTL